MATPLRSIRDVLGIGAITGTIAGLAVGAIDAVWSWKPAAQFVPGFVGRVRYVAFSALSLATLGLVLGLLTAAVLVGLWRFTRLGSLADFVHRQHVVTRERDARDAT